MRGGTVIYIYISHSHYHDINVVQLSCALIRRLISCKLNMETNHTTESIRHRHAYSADRENDNTPAVLAHLVWEEVKVEAKNLRNGAKKKLINSLSGYAQPDRIMAIMGPSGSGKSTFLDALAGIFIYTFYILLHIIYYYTHTYIYQLCLKQVKYTCRLKFNTLI